MLLGGAEDEPFSYFHSSCQIGLNKCRGYVLHSGVLANNMLHQMLFLQITPLYHARVLNTHQHRKMGEIFRLHDSFRMKDSFSKNYTYQYLCLHSDLNNQIPFLNCFELTFQVCILSIKNNQKLETFYIQKLLKNSTNKH